MAGRDEVVHLVAGLGDPDLAGEAMQFETAAVSIHAEGLATLQVTSWGGGEVRSCAHDPNIPRSLRGLQIQWFAIVMGTVFTEDNCIGRLSGRLWLRYGTIPLNNHP